MNGKEHGYFMAWRSLFDHPIWTSEPFTKGQAWIELIGLANHKKRTIFPRGIMVEINRGQLGWSALSLSKRWKWSFGKVRRFLKYLEQQNMIKTEQQKNHLTTIITITNYNNRQFNGITDDITNIITGGTTDGQQTETNKELKELDTLKITTKTTPLPPKGGIGFNGYEIPANLDTQEFRTAFADFQKHRIEIKKPMTPTSARKLLASLSKMGSQAAVEAINHSIANGWRGVFAPSRESKPTGSRMGGMTGDLSK